MPLCGSKETRPRWSRPFSQRRNHPGTAGGNATPWDGLISPSEKKDAIMDEPQVVTSLPSDRAAPSAPRAGSAGAQRRDLTIDILRGLAVFMMIAANLAAPALEE